MYDDTAPTTAAKSKPQPNRNENQPNQHQRSSRWTSSAASSLAGMNIKRLPEELAAPPAKPPVVDPLLLSTPPQAEKFVTGVRLPPPPAGRRHSLRGATASPGVTMETDRPCTLLVCFHDDAASTGVQDDDSDEADADGEGLGELAHQASSSSVGGSKLNLPKWATQMGLSRTNMHVRRLGFREVAVHLRRRTTFDLRNRGLVFLPRW